MGKKKHGVWSGELLQVTHHTLRELPGGSQLIQPTPQEQALLLSSDQLLPSLLELLALHLSQILEGSETLDLKGRAPLVDGPEPVQHPLTPTLRTKSVPENSRGCSGGEGILRKSKPGGSRRNRKDSGSWGWCRVATRWTLLHRRSHWVLRGRLHRKGRTRGRWGGLPGPVSVRIGRNGDWGKLWTLRRCSRHARCWWGSMFGEGWGCSLTAIGGSLGRCWWWGLPPCRGARLKRLRECLHCGLLFFHVGHSLEGGREHRYPTDGFFCMKTVLWSCDGGRGWRDHVHHPTLLRHLGSGGHQASHPDHHLSLLVEGVTPCGHPSRWQQRLAVARVAEMPVAYHVHNLGECFKFFTLSFWRPMCTLPMPPHALDLRGLMTTPGKWTVKHQDIPLMKRPPVLVQKSRHSLKPTSLSQATFWRWCHGYSETEENSISTSKYLPTRSVLVGLAQWAKCMLALEPNRGHRLNWFLFMYCIYTVMFPASHTIIILSILSVIHLISDLLDGNQSLSCSTLYIYRILIIKKTIQTRSQPISPHILMLS